MSSASGRTAASQGGASAWLARRSTGIKMLLILTVALLPLGLIALFASFQSDQARRAQRADDARVLAMAEARQIDILLLRGSAVLRAAMSAGIGGRQCDRSLEESSAGFPVPVGLAVVGQDGSVRCSTRSFSGVAGAPGGTGLAVRLLARPPGLRFTLAGADGSFGVGELPAALIARVMQRGSRPQQIVLRQDGVALPLPVPAAGFLLGRYIQVRARVANGQATLVLTQVVNPISALEVLLVLLPLLMWAAAAGIGWAVVNRLLLRPLVHLQRAVSAYRPGAGGFHLPAIASPAYEIGALGDAFAVAANQLAEREAQLEEGYNRQVRLTREVHHRVKNNLQVVASLINLHARGTQGPVAAAYASIQRRVDALAVVHRNHYAEAEENRGVALRSIVAELTANLRATAPEEASHLAVTLDMVPAFVSQDVAVPVAFLLTEIVELVMACDPTGSVAITLAPTEDPARALLTAQAPGLAGEACLGHPSRERFERIVTGLSRQLRSQLEIDPATGRHSIRIAIFPRDPSTAEKI